MTNLQGRILSGERELGQAELLERAARAASGFAAMGVGNEDAVAIMLRNDFPFFEASMAASMLGAHAVPLNWHFGEEEGGYILRDCAAKVLVVHADLLPQIVAAGDGKEIKAQIGDTAECKICNACDPVRPHQNRKRRRREHVCDRIRDYRWRYAVR